MNTKALLIKNIDALYSGQDLIKTEGRQPRFADLSRFKNIDIRCDQNTGLIVEVGFKLNASAGDTVIDASGYLVTPAWVDSHTHTLFGGERSKEFFMRWSGESYQDISAKGGGIHNTVRDTESATDEQLCLDLEIRLRNMLLSGTGFVEVKTGYASCAKEELRFLRLLKEFQTKTTSSPGLPQISPTFLALHAVPKNKTEYDFTQEMISILKTVAQEKLADHVDAFPEIGFFSLESCLDISRHAKDLGLVSKIHCDELSDLRSSEYYIAMGARSIDHLQKINKTAVQMLATASTVATLMPATSFYLGLEFANARQLVDGGAIVALATDYNPGTAPCSQMSFTQTLAAKDMRLTPAEIFAASTYNAAQAVGKQNSLGVVAAGYYANLNFYKANSLEEVFYTLSKPSLVINRAQKATT
jgi:imidazolonepropionase